MKFKDVVEHIGVYPLVTLALLVVTVVIQLSVIIVTL